MQSRFSPTVALIIEIVSGALAGAFVLILAVVTLFATRLFDTYSAWLVASVFYPAGAGVGVWQIGQRLMHRGRLWHALVGAYIPVMLLLLLTAPFILPDTLRITLIAVSSLLPPIFAALAFNRFSRPTDALNPYDDDDVDLLAYHEQGWEDDDL